MCVSAASYVWLLTKIQYQLEDVKAKPDSSVQEETSPLQEDTPSKTQQEKIRKLRRKVQVVVDHVDIIKDEFWERRPWILSGKPGKLPTEAKQVA